MLQTDGNLHLTCLVQRVKDIAKIVKRSLLDARHVTLQQMSVLAAHKDH